jgi:hypothetical protein
MTRTGFDPRKHGFAFINRWEFDDAERERLHETFANYLRWSVIVGTAAFGPLGAFFAIFGIRALRKTMEEHLAPAFGLCGGMCFAALDFYYTHQAGRPSLREQYPGGLPDTGEKLRSYIWKRQLNSLVSLENLSGDGARFLAWVIALKHVPHSWPFRGGPAWLLAQSKEEWQKLKSSLDQGEPTPIGLVRDSGNVYDDHQVLAIGYDQRADGGTITVYDPNCPDVESTIDITFGEHQLVGDESCGSPLPLLGFFCETYEPRHPPERIG